MDEIILLDRDKRIIREINRWKAIQGRHIRELVGFTGQRACDRRLRKLVQAGYLTKERILYGVAGIYKNTSKAIKIEKLPLTKGKIRIEQIKHDIAVLDTAIYFNKNYKILYNDIISEIQLHRLDGFGIRRHRPDFIYKKDGKTTCVEIELTLKSKDRFLNIIKTNFLEYEKQIWIVPDLDSKIAKTLEKNKIVYSNIEIIELSKIQETQEK